VPPARASRPLRFQELLRHQTGTSLMRHIGSYRVLHFSKSVQRRKSSFNQILPALNDIMEYLGYERTPEYSLSFARFGEHFLLWLVGQMTLPE
jgi:hypothetical protein